jgi:hypothetical protein
MEIRIHTDSGSVETFFQDNPGLVTPIFKGIQSTKVFATRNHHHRGGLLPHGRS